MNNTKRSNPEYLSNDILDEDFVSTFAVFHRVQFALGSCRVDVKDRFATAPTQYQKCYTIFCILMTIVMTVFITEKYVRIHVKDESVLQLCKFGFWFDFGFFLCVIVNIRFCNGQDNADFFVQMQKIDRIMMLGTIKGINVMTRNVNNYWVLLFSSGSFIALVLSIAEVKTVYYVFAGNIYTQLVIMVEMIFCSNLALFFYTRLKFVNSIMKNHLAQLDKTNNLNVVSNSLRGMALETHNFLSSDTVTYLKELFDLFTMFQNLYRLQLFVLCSKLVLQSSYVFGLGLLFVQRNVVSDKVVVSSTVLFRVIELFITISLGVRLQLFFGEVKNMKRLSIALMEAYPNGPLREKARQMFKLAEETPPKLSIYDMYEMDARILVTLFSLTTTLVVTMLQFIYL